MQRCYNTPPPKTRSCTHHQNFHQLRGCGSASGTFCRICIWEPCKSPWRSAIQSAILPSASCEEGGFIPLLWRTSWGVQLCRKCGKGCADLSGGRFRSRRRGLARAQAPMSAPPESSRGCQRLKCAACVASAQPARVSTVIITSDCIFDVPDHPQKDPTAGCLCSTGVISFTLL